MSNTAPLQCVISGAQIGADIAGLRAAHACGITTGGYMPLGYKTKNGNLPLELVRTYALEQTEVSTYPARTEMNVMHSAGTVRFAYNYNSPGEKCTLKFIQKWNQPYIDIPIWFNRGGGLPHIPSDVLLLTNFIINNNITTLNVAGNADVLIEPIVEAYLKYTFGYLEGRNATTERDVLVW